MNSCLQSLEDFVGAFISQEQVWSSDTEAALIRYSTLKKCCDFILKLYPVQKNRDSSSDPSSPSPEHLWISEGLTFPVMQVIIHLLIAFKDAVSVWSQSSRILIRKCMILRFYGLSFHHFPSVCKLLCVILCISAGCSLVPHLRTIPEEVFGPRRGQNLQPHSHVHHTHSCAKLFLKI